MKKVFSVLFLVIISISVLNVFAQEETDVNKNVNPDSETHYQMPADQLEVLLSMLERLRLAYNLGDANFLSNIYDKNVLLINEGEIIKTPDEAIYIEDSGNVNGNLPIGIEKFIESGDTAKRINFRDIMVNGNPGNIKDKGSNLYTTCVEQEIFFDGYKDTVYLFLIWDFGNPKQPKIIGKGVTYYEPLNFENFGIQ